MTDMNMKPCPFCGGTEDENNACQMAKVVLRPFRSAIDTTAYRVECGCGAQGPGVHGHVAAVDAWNNRADGQSPK
jgi:hypothetical protein